MEDWEDRPQHWSLGKLLGHAMLLIACLVVVLTALVGGTYVMGHAIAQAIGSATASVDVGRDS